MPASSASRVWDAGRGPRWFFTDLNALVASGSSADWARVATTALTWILVPLGIGWIRVVRSDIH